jgi:hypothetical protein
MEVAERGPKAKGGGLCVARGMSREGRGTGDAREGRGGSVSLSRIEKKRRTLPSRSEALC